MDYVNLGKTDTKVSKITFGCWEMGGAQWVHTSDENNDRAINVAFDNGVTAFDTAEGYGNGHSEEVLGRALADKRDKCFIATKVAPDHLRARDIRNSITASLKRLGTDYVDLYYIHWPNKDIPLEETMGEMSRLKKEGLIKAIGVSNFNVSLLRQALVIDRIEAVQNEWSLLQRDIEKEMEAFCVEQHISIMSYSSIAKGILTGAFHFGGTKLPEDDFRFSRRLFLPDHLEEEKPLLNIMKEIAKNKHILISQLAISWLLHKNSLCSAIVGTQSEKHFLENIESLKVSLSPEDIASLDTLSAKTLARIDGQ
ncbi:MAG: aldo/keto reductase [Treponema sp.]|jgi:aryl-alcohol dehydrogenase-like predicted oxidoreductase|nr:aldo/keto reductase [Treponema sp.]